MFMPIKFTTTIILLPVELNNDFDKTIITKVRNTLENSCSKHGYIKKDSIKIIKRSAGYIKEAHLNGNIAYDLSCIAEICNPVQDSIIKCVVKAKNNLGLRAIGMYEDMAILEVIIPRITSGIQSEINIDDVNIGDSVNVLVCGKKFTLYDKMISIVGKIIKDKNNEIQLQEIEDDDVSIDDEYSVPDEEGNDIDIENIYDDYEEEEEDGIKKINIDIAKKNAYEYEDDEEDDGEEDDEEDDDDEADEEEDVEDADEADELYDDDIDDEIYDDEPDKIDDYD
jgi:DNA-directed RNA polymerase subunit E'/Rpb7